jgi:hypothetical protein
VDAAARQVTPAPRPETAAAGQRPGSAAPVGPATGTEASPGDASLDQFMAEVAARAAAAMALAA